MKDFIFWLLTSGALAIVTIFCGLKTTDAWNKYQIKNGGKEAEISFDSIKQKSTSGPNMAVSNSPNSNIFQVAGDLNIGSEKHRRLTEAQIKKISDLLAQYPSQTIAIQTADGDSETNQFANDIRKAFRAANWDVSTGDIRFTVEKKGLIILVGTNPPPDRAVWIYKALDSVGAQPMLLVNIHAPVEECIIIVASKD